MQHDGPSRLVLQRTVVTSFSSGSGTDDGVYVLHLSSSSSSAGVGCALSDRSLHVYDRTTLQRTHHVPGAHAAPITDLVSTPSSSSFVSSGRDGCVRLFDTRTSGASASWRLPADEEALTVDVGYDGALVAVGGSRANVHFFDLRHGSGSGSGSGGLLGSYVDAHTDLVTCVRFASPSSPTLLTASEDGLLATHDTSQPSEEAALVSVMNVGTAVRSAGFFGPRREGVYCLTGSETLSVWHHDSAQPVCDFGGHGLRERLRRATSGTASEIHYLVGCRWSEEEQTLRLLAGSSDGNAAVFRLDATGTVTPTDVLSHGHRGCVRAFDWSSSSSSGAQPVLFTGGEDARLCEWSTTSSSTTDDDNKQAGTTTTNSGNGQATIPHGGGVTRKKKTKKNAHAPY